MSTMIANSRSVLANLEHGFTMWLHRTYSRNELRNLSDRDLRDIGLCRTEARWEASKPFWMV
ncbi:MAG TPA: DUF1127 domain-containing protein [Xanthobacteraceae bacterium]|jgi:uncharacterized protein YjiS (DUF1127 family)|nr:DUF1127 domain-containing protein [Xanthobacteraceae bacterium]